MRAGVGVWCVVCGAQGVHPPSETGDLVSTVRACV